MTSANTSPSWLERPVFRNPQNYLTLENLLIVIILILAILSRFVMLGERVMSHDEVNHVVPSYDLFQGKRYDHSPVTHGPFQFHIVALSYFLFGDNDFTSRVPAALFSVGAIAFVLFAFRRYLGRSGALVAGVLFLISPFMMYYGRYTRNEGFIELIGVATLYGILRYLEKGDRFAMFLVTISTVMHFIVKETSFIYTAQALIFLFFMFMVEARRAEIKRPERYNRFLIFMTLAMMLVMVALGLAVMKADQSNALFGAAPQSEEIGPAQEEPAGSLLDPAHLRLYGEIVAVTGALVLGALGLFTLATDIGWKQMKRLRSFTLLILIGTLILPMLSPLPVTMLGWDPLDYANSTSMLRTGVFIALFFVIAIAVGIWWNPVLWLQNAFLFYAIFIVFYTTFFTNGNGFFTGIVGSLGYWLSQQGVERGSQPRYYYALIQMPIYEFLAYLGSVLAVYFGIKYARFSTIPGFSPARAPHTLTEENNEAVPPTRFQ
jgi:predicted membrane-bound mannosyltransferase